MVGKIEVMGQEVAIASADGSTIIGPIAAKLHQAEIQVEQLTLRAPSLDDVFLEVTGNRMQKNNIKGEERQ